MCKGKEFCSLLGTDTEEWSRKSPLPPPPWFKKQIDIFSKAVRLASIGKVEESIATLNEIRSDELREWYCEHGQVSGRFRNKLLKLKNPKDIGISLHKLRSPDPLRAKVFARDHFTCQYCGGKVVSKELLSAYAKVVGYENFCTSGTNAERHGVVLAFRANADHITPWNRGGRTDLENLTTCCWSCNYGKAGYSIDEIGLDNPRDNHYSNTKWNGLGEYIEALLSVSKKKR